MKKAVNSLIVADLLFVVFLAVSGALDGWLSDTVYVLAFIIPLAAALLLNKRELSHEKLFRLGKRELVAFLPLVPITVLLVIGLSFVTSGLLGLFGASDEVVLEGSFFTAVLRYALFTAIFEELLFRYLPMRLTAKHSPRLTVILSALFFALVHCNLFQLPYAFLAGAVFIAIDMMCGSVIPSMIIHFLNNLLSVIVYFYGESKAFITVYPIVLSVMSAFAIAYIVLKKDEYIASLRPVLERGSFTASDYINSVLLIVPTLTVAVTSAFA